MVKKDGYNLEFIFDEEVTIEADETRIAQAFYNILINGINYTGNNKVVVIKQTVNSGFVKIEVIDSGDGIPEENIQYIWDRYYKVDKSHKRAITGTGLGLSIVKSIIDMHGGKYGVDSKINSGSKFWFTLRIHTKFTEGTS
jgi:signal transduction histidine kinase